jgi:SAM-dependent methyltransferase
MRPGFDSDTRVASFDHARVADRGDIEFYVDRARTSDGPVLEMGCGTGRVHLPLLAAGVDADGFDLSPARLAVLQDAATAAGLEPSVWQADMRSFAADRAYDLVVCPFNTFQLLRTLEAQRAALASAYDVLKPGGRLVFDVFVPSFDLVCETYGEWQSETVRFEGEGCEFRHRARIADEVAQEVRVEHRARDADGEVLFEREFGLTLLPPRQVQLLAEVSPFDDWRVTGDFSDEPLADGHSSQVWTLEKRA